MIMGNSGEAPQITNMGELINGIEILFGTKTLTSGDQKAVASLVYELAEFRGEKGLNILRALVRGEIAAADARKVIYAPPY
jgi:hypothetical protein